MSTCKLLGQPITQDMAALSWHRNLGLQLIKRTCEWIKYLAGHSFNCGILVFCLIIFSAYFQAIWMFPKPMVLLVSIPKSMPSNLVSLDQSIWACLDLVLSPRYVRPLPKDDTLPCFQKHKLWNNVKNTTKWSGLALSFALNTKKLSGRKKQWHLQGKHVAHGKMDGCSSSSQPPPLAGPGDGGPTTEKHGATHATSFT